MKNSDKNSALYAVFMDVPIGKYRHIAVRRRCGCTQDYWFDLKTNELLDETAGQVGPECPPYMFHHDYKVQQAFAVAHSKH